MSTDKKANDGRWWEFYFVRYFLGTIIGAAIVLYLNSSSSSLNKHLIGGVTDVAKLDAPQLFMLAVLGLAYCYIASAPVLVLHATRGVYLAKDTKAFEWFFYGSLILVCVSAWAFYAAQSSPSNENFRSYVPLAIVLAFQLVPIAFAINRKGERVHMYYLNLATARSQDTEATRQYVESYKHLREHGNAFFILLFEVVLGMILASAPNTNFALVAVIVWIVPATLVWLIGTVLEYRFANISPKP